MNSNFRQTMSKPVVRLEDIVTLRNHLERKYPELSPYDRAEMMSEGIHKMVESNLTGLDSDIRSKLVKALISNQLIQQHQPILKIDILNGILKTDIHPEYLIAKTWNWYVMNTGHAVTLSDFIEQSSPYLPHHVRNAISDGEPTRTNFSSYTARNKISEPVITRSETDIAADIIQDADAVDAKPPVLNDIPIISAPKPWFFTKFTKAHHLTSKGKILLAGFLCTLMVIMASPLLYNSMVSSLHKNSSASLPMDSTKLPTAEVVSFGASQLPLLKPEYLRYQNVSIERLKSFLEQKNSKLLTEDYLEQLLQYSCEKDLNPLLLIAIIGQEQNYVPLQHPFAQRMIENPFNIYGSWETHPVGFTASLKEACYTINKALEGRTLYSDPFEVINNRYAEDAGWYLGVKVIFRDLMAVAGE